MIYIVEMKNVENNGRVTWKPVEYAGTNKRKAKKFLNDVRKVGDFYVTYRLTLYKKVNDDNERNSS